MIFKGNLSLELDTNEMEYIRSGFCGIRCNLTQKPSSEYDGIALRVKPDGKSYRVNLKGDSWNPNDLFIGFVPKSDEWITCELRFDQLLSTSEGKMRVNNFVKLKSYDIRSFGISIADEQEGPFELQIASVELIADMYRPFPNVQKEEKVREKSIPRKDEAFAF